MKLPLLVSIQTELHLIDKLGTCLLRDGYSAANSFIVTVSTDYSSIVGQILRHKLTHDREICEGFGVDVPYPDETWSDSYINKLNSTLNLHKELFNKTPILVEAAVIRGGNYSFLVDQIKKEVDFKGKIITLTLYENIHSKFKSDYVGSFYNNDLEDVTFWWEKDNKHWS